VKPTCMQLACMHASHEYTNIQEHTALAKSGEARSVTCDVSAYLPATHQAASHILILVSGSAAFVVPHPPQTRTV